MLEHHAQLTQNKGCDTNEMRHSDVHCYRSSHPEVFWKWCSENMQQIYEHPR